MNTRLPSHCVRALPRKKTQAEKDDQIIDSLAAQYAEGQLSQQDLYRALLEAGRASAKEEDK